MNGWASSNDTDALDALNHALRDADPRVRLAALNVLHKMGYLPDCAELVNMLSDPDAAVRRAVALALGFQYNVKAIEPLMKLLYDPQLAVRAAAITALGKIHGNPRTISVLLAVLDDPAPEMRKAGAGALAGIAQLNDWRELLPTAERDDDDKLQKLLRWDEVAAALAGLLADPDLTVRHVAITSLLAFHDPHATHAQLFEAMTDADAETRIAAINAAGEAWRNDAGVIDQFCALLATERDAEVRSVLAQQLYTIVSRQHTAHHRDVAGAVERPRRRRA